MDCLVLPVSIFSRACSGKRLGYRQLTDDFFVGSNDPITVVVGKEKKEFLVDPFVLDENPFRVLIELVMSKDNSSRKMMVDFGSGSVPGASPPSADGGSSESSDESGSSPVHRPPQGSGPSPYNNAANQQQQQAQQPAQPMPMYSGMTWPNNTINMLRN